ncbi:MAG: hypothetical protein ACM3S1_09155 [Hyphomicrobiales bacterium]
MVRLRAAVIALLALCLLPLAGGASPVRANGVPQLVKLTYLDGVSNYGPHDAEGVLEFSFAEAYARIEVKNLPPEPGVTYEGWMVAPDGSALWIGEIPVQPDGVGSYETKIEGLDRYDYSLFVIAARVASTPKDAVPSERSIAGRFTVIQDEPGALPRSDIAQRPGTLPDTGEPAPGTPWGRIVTTAGVMAGTALILFGIRRARKRSAA